jgi:hypothetical protein
MLAPKFLPCEASKLFVEILGGVGSGVFHGLRSSSFFPPLKTGRRGVILGDQTGLENLPPEWYSKSLLIGKKMILGTP